MLLEFEKKMFLRILELHKDFAINWASEMRNKASMGKSV